jgi:hypothetical protein
MVLRSAISLLIFVLLHSGALAAKRIALVIGTQLCDRGWPLRNPHKDIRIVGAALAKVGFEVLAAVKLASRDQILHRQEAKWRTPKTRPLPCRSL